MRLVSLCPSLTELVFDLGLGGSLVGRTEYCVHPQPDVGQVEALGGTKSPDLARIIALAPDLVLMNEEENRRQDATALAQAGIRIHSSFPKDCLGTAQMVREIAALLEVQPAGERIGAEIETRYGRVVAGAKGRAPVRFAYLIWRKPWMVTGADTFAHALLAQAGGQNVFGASQERYPTVEVAQLAAASPDLVLLCTEPFPFQAKHITELSTATGLAPERFVIADGEYLSWHGSRTPDGIDYAAGLIEAGRPPTSC